MDIIFVSVCDVVYEIINKKGVIFYGVVVVLVCIIKVILNNENVILLFFVYLDGYYGMNDIYIGVFVVVNC